MKKVKMIVIISCFSHWGILNTNINKDFLIVLLAWTKRF